ncbi:hypothetical protein MRY82_00915 [bacterium]|nr:hypothetical protein [bacterium]
MDEKMKMKATLKTIIAHGALAISMLSLTFCAPAIPDYGSGIHKLQNGDNPEDAMALYNEETCLALGGYVEPDGKCSTTYPTAGFTDQCQTPITQADSLACNEQQGVEENGGQFWGALLAVVGKEVLSIVKDLKNENIHGEWLKTYAKKALNVTSPGGKPLDGESSINSGSLKKHRLFLKKFMGNVPSGEYRGLASLQFELEAKGESIATMKNIAYGKKLLMCLNASYVHDASNDNNTSDTKIALQMKSKYNSHEKPITITAANFYAKCNSASQEQSYIAFQLHNAQTFHVYPFNPKDMGFSKAGNSFNLEPEDEYTIYVDGQPKKMRYYAANNQLDLGMDNFNVASAMFTDTEFGNSATNNQVLENKNPGTSGAEVQNSQNSFSNRQEFQKQYLHISSGSDSGTRTFCNANSAQVGC